jgi:predicted nucleotidyltransferase
MDEEALQEIVEKLILWAEQKSQILELWIYGSRAKGTARIESDLDIAYQISPLSTEKEKIEFWEKVLPRWKQEIQEFIPWQLHLEAKVTVKDYICESGKKIYQAA